MYWWMQMWKHDGRWDIPWAWLLLHWLKIIEFIALRYENWNQSLNKINLFGDVQTLTFPPGHSTHPQPPRKKVRRGKCPQILFHTSGNHSTYLNISTMLSSERSFATSSSRTGAHIIAIVSIMNEVNDWISRALWADCCFNKSISNPSINLKSSRNLQTIAGISWLLYTQNCWIWKNLCFNPSLKYICLLITVARKTMQKLKIFDQETLFRREKSFRRRHWYRAWKSEMSHNGKHLCRKVVHT